MSTSSLQKCLFCGKPQNEVGALIGGAGKEARICNECVSACVEILRARGLAPECDRCADLELAMDNRSASPVI